MYRINWNLNEAISMFKLITGMIWAEGLLFSIYINCMLFVNYRRFFCKCTWLRDIIQTNKISNCKKATTFLFKVTWTWHYSYLPAGVVSPIVGYFCLSYVNIRPTITFIGESMCIHYCVWMERLHLVKQASLHS